MDRGRAAPGPRAADRRDGSPRSRPVGCARRRPAPTTSTSWRATSSPSRRAPVRSTAGRSCSPGTGSGRSWPRRPPSASASRAARLVLDRRRPRRHRRRDRPGRRRVPARARRAARGHALDVGVPARPPVVGSRDAGTPTRSRPPGRPSSRRPPAASCRRRGRTRSRPASGRCSRYRPDATCCPASTRRGRRRPPRRRRGDDDATGVGDDLPAGVRVVDVSAPGHNLLRYRPDEVTAAILGR